MSLPPGEEEELLACPFCGYRAVEYDLILHIEERHSEGDSPFVPRTDQGSSGLLPGRSASSSGGFILGDATDPGTPDVQYVECPVDGCGEVVLADELGYHIDLHAQEEGIDEVDSVRLQPSPTLVGTSSSTSHSPVMVPPLVVAGSSPTQARSSRSTHHHSSHHHSSHQSSSHDRDRDRDRDRSHRHHHGSSRSGTTSSNGRDQMNSRSTILGWRELLNMPSSSSSSRRRQHQHHHDKKAGSSSREAPGSPGTYSDGSASSYTMSPHPQLPSPHPTPSSSAAHRKRLGKAELGKYAHEHRMPDWLIAHLQKGGEVKASGILPVLEQLLEQSPSTKWAFLCHPGVQHVSKLKKEGGFCGYRNIQMMTSYINCVRFQGHEAFDGQIPSIFQIQDFIEDAWDKGINAQGRVETGGVRGTRKYIGTPEAQAVFCSLDVPCEAQGFKNREPGKSETRLLQDVERYFQSGDFDPEYKVRRTNLPPIYFQHAGHSMTIVGIERLKGGHTNLLVFDPMFRDSSSITKLVGREFEHRFPDLALKPYRRGNKYLRKYREFEVLRLRPPPTSSPTTSSPSLTVGSSSAGVASQLQQQQQQQQQSGQQTP